MEGQSINERIQVIVNKVFSNNVSDFCRKTGISTGTMSTILGERKSKPSFKTIESMFYAIAEDGVSLEWIMFGRGDMFKVNKEERPDEMESLKNKIMILEEKLKDKDGMIDKLLNRLSPTENVKDEQSSVRSA